MNERPDPIQEGAEAYSLGILRANCPYDHDTKEREQWLEGWNRAKATHDHIVADDN